MLGEGVLLRHLIRVIIVQIGLKLMLDRTTLSHGLRRCHHHLSRANNTSAISSTSWGRQTTHHVPIEVVFLIVCLRCGQVGYGSLLWVLHTLTINTH